MCLSARLLPHTSNTHPAGHRANSLSLTSRGGHKYKSGGCPPPKKLTTTPPPPVPSPPVWVGLGRDVKGGSGKSICNLSESHRGRTYGVCVARYMYVVLDTDRRIPTSYFFSRCCLRIFPLSKKNRSNINSTTQGTDL